MTAMPAATDIPTIEPVDKPPPSPSDSLVFVGNAALDDVGVALFVTITVSVSPAEFVPTDSTVEGRAIEVEEIGAAVVKGASVVADVVGSA